MDSIEIDPTGASLNQVLKFNGTKFVAAADAAGVQSVSYEETIGNNTNTSFAINHNLGTKDLNVIVRENISPYDVVEVNWEATTINTVTVDFSAAPTTNSKRVVIKGPGTKEFYSTVIGDGSNSTIIVNHGLNSRNIVPVIRNVDSPFEVVEVLSYATSLNSVTLDFSAAPEAASLIASVYLLDINNSYFSTIGDGTNNEFTITHNLDTRDIGATCRSATSPYEFVSVRWEATTANTAKIIFSSPPTANSRKIGVYTELGGSKYFNSEVGLFDGDLSPAIDNVYELGTSALRWKSISIGGGTLYITDSGNGNQVAITVNNGVFNVDGIAQAQLANVKVTNLTFNDNTVQTTAYTGGYSSGAKVRYTSNFTATELTYTGSSSTAPGYNSYYSRVGDMVTFSIQINMSTVTNFGTGQYNVELPFLPVNGMLNHFTGWVWVDPSQPADDLNGHIIINADHHGYTKTLDLHWLKGSTSNPKPIIESLLTQNNPVTLTTSSILYVNGTYIAG